MLSLEEQKKIQRLVSLLVDENSERVPSSPDVSNRLRDQQGRFLPNESKSKSLEELRSRSIKIVKVKGSYGTYLVKERLFDEAAVGVIVTLGIIVFMAIAL